MLENSLKSLGSVLLDFKTGKNYEEIGNTYTILDHATSAKFFVHEYYERTFPH